MSTPASSQSTEHVVSDDELSHVAGAGSARERGVLMTDIILEPLEAPVNPAAPG